MKHEEIVYNVNGREFAIKTQDKDYSLSMREYEKRIYNALNKIGVEDKYISIKTDGKKAILEWEINKEKHRFECDIYDWKTKNLSGICDAIQSDVRQIRRGIKTLWSSMRQYESLPKPGEVSDDNPYSDMDLSELKQLMKVHHPDTGSGDKEKFEKIKSAYEMKKQTKGD